MWKTVFDSVCGTSHKDTGLPCQDACRVVELKVDGGTLLAVCCADGAGSASHAADGAEIVCDTFIRITRRDCQSIESCEGINREKVIDWFREMRSEVETRANGLGVGIRELASTFLGAVVGESKAVFMQIGDGAMVTLEGEGYRTVFWPQSGEFANITNFVTDAQFEERVEWVLYNHRVDELAAFSDGLERLILRFADRTVHHPFLSPMFAALRVAEDPEVYFEHLRHFLDSAKVNERSNDDKTLILATRMNPSNHDDAVR